MAEVFNPRSEAKSYIHISKGGNQSWDQKKMPE